MSHVVALACADIHLSHNPPVARSAEPDWYAAMARALKELGKLSSKYDGCPIICGGDVFHKWNSPPELITFAMEYLPPMSVIPGQHDLPYHELAGIERSAYRTAEIGMRCCTDLSDGNVDHLSECVIYGFPWGTPIIPNTQIPEYDNRYQIAVCHQYVYAGRSTCYATAPKEAKLSNLKDQLEGYDVAIFGDNHIGFISKVGDCNVINCGSLICRNADQIDYKPMVGLIYSDGHIEPHYLDTSQDKWSVEVVEEKDESLSEELSEFLETLQSLDITDLDFGTTMRRYLADNDVSQDVQKTILKAMGG